MARGIKILIDKARFQFKILDNTTAIALDLNKFSQLTIGVNSKGDAAHVKNIFNKLRDFVGMNDPVEYEYEYEEEGDAYRNGQQQQVQQSPEEDLRQRRRVRERITVEANSESGAAMNNVIGMPGSGNRTYEVIVMEPRHFDEVAQAIQALRERKSVVLNLTQMEQDEAQRAVDFVAGGTFAIDGDQRRVGDNIFLFTPICVQVTLYSGTEQELAKVQVRSTTITNQGWSPESTRIAHSS